MIAKAAAQELVRQGFESLTTRQQEIFLARAEGLSTREIARIFDFNRQTVLQHLAAAERRILRHIVYSLDIDITGRE